MPIAGPETFLEILEDFLSRQIGRSTLCGKDNWNHSKIFFLTTINFVLSLFLLFINPQIFICTYFFLFLVLLFLNKFISFYFSYFYNIFSLYYTFPTFLVLYFCYSRFQCLFPFMALLVWVLSSFLFSLFILPFFLCEYEFMSSCVPIWLMLLSTRVSELFLFVLCLYVLLNSFPLFLSFSISLLCCMVYGLLVLQQGLGSEPPRWDNWVKDIGPPENSWILTMRAFSKAIISTQRPNTIQRSASSTTRCSHQTTSKARKQLYQLADSLLKVIPSWQKYYNTPLGMIFHFRKTISNSNHQNINTSPPTRKKNTKAWRLNNTLLNNVFKHSSPKFF